MIDHWGSKEATAIILDKEIYISHTKCYLYKVTNGIISCQIVRELECIDHEEADTKIIFLLSRLQEPCDVVVQCSDTDILVILLGNVAHLLDGRNVWLLFGTGNSRQYVNILEIHDEIGSKICTALPAFHDLTGCDYNPSFHKMGKSRPWKIFQSNEEFIDAFTKIQWPGTPTYESSIQILKKFVCHIYGTKKKWAYKVRIGR